MDVTYDLSPKAVADLLAVHEDTVRRWALTGALAFMRTPGGWMRFRRQDVDAFIEQRRVNGEAMA